MTLQPPEPAPAPVAEPPVEEVKDDKALSMLEPLDQAVSTELSQRAEKWLNTVAALNPHSQEFQAQIIAIGNVARKTFESTAQTSSRFMEKSLRDAKAEGSKSQQQVSSSLLELRTVMNDLAPSDKTFAQKALGWVPGFNAIKKYFNSFESNQKQLNSVLRSLDAGQEQLQRDNAELAVERRKLWEDLHELQRAEGLLEQIDEQVVGKIESLKSEGQAEQAGILEKDLLFAVRQRRQDIQTQIAVTIQSYLSMGIIDANNRQLIQGVDRAKTTTVTALRTAVITAEALENQKLVLDQIDAVNKTTNDLINRTSDMLAQNSVRTQKQAVESGVAVETLNRAFDSVFKTMDGIDQFRIEANKNFAQTIDVLKSQVDRAQPYLDRQNGNGQVDELVSNPDSAQNLLEI